MDNTVKLIAIYTRMQANIPVIIMGETGCGKTRLIQYLCSILRKHAIRNLDEGTAKEVENLITLRIHGGITGEDIQKCVKRAEDSARFITEKCDGLVYTVVFFDEANTTREVDLIREIMCNHTMHGKPINSAIRFIAAVNPYRRHHQSMIDELKNAGCGYSTDSSKTHDRIGNIPLRELVYRVHPLPPALRPLVWDFGTMDDKTEREYTKLMLHSRIELVKDEMYVKLAAILGDCQVFLRQSNFGFVSLRDISRFIQVFLWFRNKMELIREVAGDHDTPFSDKSDVTLAAALAIGVCYYVRLSTTRFEFLEHIAPQFDDDFGEMSAVDLQMLIIETQNLVMKELKKTGITMQCGGQDIAHNEALTENVFMMVVCIELRIPLFLVGHPGSSKSLAKTIVKSCMSGSASSSKLFANLTHIDMTSFQCSPHSEAEAIQKTFETAKDDTGRCAPVVVLDEIGLAEDSEKMPLKALHSLLEPSEDDVSCKIAFIGISNWALDPAKMNRGLYVTRQPPSVEELTKTACDIIGFKEDTDTINKERMRKLAKMYLAVHQEFADKSAESSSKAYIGLRDYYSMVKMMHRETDKHNQDATTHDVLPIHKILKCVMRNFGGICKESNDKVMEIFQAEEHFGKVESVMHPNTLRLISDNLLETDRLSRYMMIVTPELESILPLIETKMKNAREQKLKDAREKKQTDSIGEDSRPNPRIMFHSDFPDDTDYTKVCKNINEFKNWVENGEDIILIDMKLIYESLYDVLNQSYRIWNNRKYVEIGLERHRMTCRVPDTTQVVLIAKPNDAAEFPIPLLNRLEKHFLRLVDKIELQGNENIVSELQNWVDQIVGADFDPSEVFVGYHSETIQCLVCVLCGDEESSGENSATWNEEKVQECKEALFRTMTLDGFVRLPQTEEMRDRFRERWKATGGLREAFSYSCKLQEKKKNCVVTTFSPLPSKNNLDEFFRRCCDQECKVLNIQDFASKNEFEKAIVKDKDEASAKSGVLVILVDPDFYKQLSFLRYSLQHVKDWKGVLIITQILRNSKSVDWPQLFYSEFWDNVHVDDLHIDRPVEVQFETLLEGPTDYRPISKLLEGTTDELSLGKILEQNKGRILCGNNFHHGHENIDPLITLFSESGKVQNMVKIALSTYSDRQWVADLARDKTALRSSTSFQQLLHRRLTMVVMGSFANVFARVDRDGNVALLQNPQLVHVWNELLELDIKNLSIEGNTSQNVEIHNLETATVTVEHTLLNNIDQESDTPLQFPFSWVVRESVDAYVKTARLGSVGVAGFDVDNVAKKFAQEVNCGIIISQVDGWWEALLHDLVNTIYCSRDKAEMKAIHSIAASLLDTGGVIHVAVSFFALETSQKLREVLNACQQCFTALHQISKNLFGDVKVEEVKDVESFVRLLLQQLTSSFVEQANIFQVPIRTLLNYCHPDVKESWKALLAQRLWSRYQQRSELDFSPRGATVEEILINIVCHARRSEPKHRKDFANLLTSLFPLLPELLRKERQTLDVIGALFNLAAIAGLEAKDKAAFQNCVIRALLTRYFNSQFNSQSEQCYVECFGKLCINTDRTIDRGVVSKIILDHQFFSSVERTEAGLRVFEEFSKMDCSKRSILVVIRCVSRMRQRLKDLAREIVDTEGSLAVALGEKTQPLRNILDASDHWKSPKLYFLKQVFRDRGTELLRVLQDNRELQWLSPVEAVTAQREDCFYLLGENYTSSSLMKTIVDVPGAVADDSRDCDCLTRLAAVSFTQSRNLKVHQTILEQLKNEMSGEVSEEAFDAIATPREEPYSEPVALLLISLWLNEAKHPLLRILKLIRGGQNIDELYVPGMRDFPEQEIMNQAGTTWYKCDNGHPYAIGECGRPMQASRCPECGAAIGGEGHRFVGTTGRAFDRNQIVNNERGYNLVPNRPLMDSERDLSPLYLNTTRWLIHAAYQAREGASEADQAAASQNMAHDVRGVREAAQLDADECDLYLTLVVLALFRSGENAHFPCATKAERLDVERATKRALVRVSDRPKGRVLEARALIQRDLNLASNPLLRQLLEVDRIDWEELKCAPELWESGQYIDHRTLLNAWRNKPDDEDKASFPFLRAFSEVFHQMHLIEELPVIVDFHRKLHGMFSCRITYKEALEKTIGDLFEDHPSLKDGFKSWLKVWKEIGMCNRLPRVPEELRDLDENTRLTVFLPDCPGLPLEGKSLRDMPARDGIVSVHILAGLVDLHNRLVGPTKLEKKHIWDRMLPIEKRKHREERLNLLTLKSHYYVQREGGSEVAYDLSVIEEWLESDLLAGIHPIYDELSNYSDKRLRVTYKEDMNWPMVCEEASGVVEQSRIPIETQLPITDLITAQKLKEALAQAIFFVRSGNYKAAVPLSELSGIPALKELPPDLTTAHLVDAWHITFNDVNRLSHVSEIPFAEENVGTILQLPEKARNWAEKATSSARRYWMVELHRLYVDWGFFNAAPGSLDEMPLFEVLDYYRDSDRTILPLDDKYSTREGLMAISDDVWNELYWEHCMPLWIELNEQERGVHTAQ